jgi:N-acetylglucosamine kinase-like BadF-type ATPase
VTRYFLGVDVGGTKSHALVADESGRALGLGRGGAGSWEVVGYAGLAAILQDITDQALGMAAVSRSQLAGAGFGIAGFDWPSQREPTGEALQSLGLSAPCTFVNDTLIGLIAGATQGWGVAVVSGTGCNCRGRNREGQEGRVIGGGARFAEYAGAGELVAKATEAVAMAWTRRGRATRLTEAFVQLTGAADAFDLLEGLYLWRYQLLAAAAPAVFQVAADGDAVAQELVRWAGRELGSLAIGVIRQLGIADLDFEVVLIGSMFKGSPSLSAALSDTVHSVAPKARLVRLAAPPVVGAVLLGMEQVGMEMGPLRKTLIDSTNKLFAASPLPPRHFGRDKEPS